MSDHASRPPMGALGEAYHRVYDFICGRHPFQRPWHFQWLTARGLHRALRRVLPTLRGAIVDVGCGHRPYRGWLDSEARYVGLDVEGSQADPDILVAAGAPWPLESASVDAIVCTQVIEHVADLDHMLGEIRRILRPGGTLIASVPFAYNEHGAPHDYRRVSVHGMRRLLAQGFEVVELSPIGAIGSTTGQFFLNWLNTALGGSPGLRLVKGLFLPMFVALSGAVNAIAVGLDHLDRTAAFYANVLAVARRVE
jgi:SAM-dependent methyltransferase